LIAHAHRMAAVIHVVRTWAAISWSVSGLWRTMSRDLATADAPGPTLRRLLRRTLYTHTQTIAGLHTDCCWHTE